MCKKINVDHAPYLSDNSCAVNDKLLRIYSANLKNVVFSL